MVHQKITKEYVNKSVDRYNQNTKQRLPLEDTTFRVDNNVKTEFDMWVWIYQEIANIRMEVSRLGTYVRINNNVSPNFLVPYHSHIYSLLLPMSVVIPNAIWFRIEKEWLICKKDINDYLTIKASVPNKKIPFKLIRQLDKLYRIALLVAQKSGLGMRTSSMMDTNEAIENAIAGD